MTMTVRIWKADKRNKVWYIGYYALVLLSESISAIKLQQQKMLLYLNIFFSLVLGCISTSWQVCP